MFCFVCVLPHLPFLDLQISWSKHARPRILSNVSWPIIKCLNYLSYPDWLLRAGRSNNASEDLDEKSTCLYTRAGRKPRRHKKHRAFSPQEGVGGVGGCVGGGVRWEEGGQGANGGGADCGAQWGPGRTREDHTLQEVLFHFSLLCSMMEKSTIIFMRSIIILSNLERCWKM